MKWADEFTPHDYKKLRPTLEAMLERVRSEDPDRAKMIDAAIDDPDFEGLAIEQLGRGMLVVRAGGIVVGRLHVSALRKDGASCN